jgi:chaperonin cofactor prefoldin
MWVSRKEFDELRNELVQAHNDFVKLYDEGYDKLESKIDTLTKQMKCSCENYEVMVSCRGAEWIWSGKHVDNVLAVHYNKVCKDCGFTFTYDTEGEALADKESLLQKQVKGLQGQIKQLKKKV